MNRIHVGTLASVAALLVVGACAFAALESWQASTAVDGPAASVTELRAHDTLPIATPTPVAVVEVVAPPAVEETLPEPVSDEPVYGQYPAGYEVPWIPSADPNNASGGEWDTTACASGHAYWENDASYCG